MTADQLEEYWDELTPEQRANELDNGLVSMMRSIDFSRTEKRLIVFMRLVVRLVKERA